MHIHRLFQQLYRWISKLVSKLGSRLTAHKNDWYVRAKIPHSA